MDVLPPGSRLKFYYKKHQSILGSGELQGTRQGLIGIWGASQNIHCFRRVCQVTGCHWSGVDI